MTSLGGTDRLGDALHKALRVYGLERKLREQEIFLRWDDIVGPALARHTQPLRLREKKLWIRVPQAVWRQELATMRRELCATINRAVGDALVEEIILR